MVRILWLLAVCLPLSALAESCTPLPAEAVDVQHQDGRYEVRMRWAGAVDRALALAVLTDFERFTEFMPELKQSRILSRQDNVYRIQQAGTMRWGPFSSAFESTREVTVEEGRHLRSRTVSSTGGDASSDLELTTVDAQTRIDYALTLRPKQWMPSAVGVRAIRHEIAEQWTALLCEMRRRQDLRSGG